MALENVQQIDIIGIDKQSGEVILSIIDDITWQDEYTHPSLLQDKINNYLRFIENGKLLAAYPDAAGRKIVLKVFITSFQRLKQHFFRRLQKLLLRQDISWHIRLWNLAKKNVKLVLVNLFSFVEHLGFRQRCYST